MQDNLPYTPADILKVSRKFKFMMNSVFGFVKVFKLWDRPYKKAAASFEEMNLIDKFYWIYKCKKPILKAEKDETYTCFKNKKIELPQAFKKENSITIGAAGDLFQMSGIDASKDIFFENVEDILFDQDISYVNFESPISDREIKTDNINDKAPPVESCSSKDFGVLKGHKGKCFTIMHTAKNHIFDVGIEGIKSTQKILEDENIFEIGTNRRPEDFGKGRIFEKNGIKLGFASATFGLNGRELPANEFYRINVCKLNSKFLEPELDLIKQQIDDCKNQNCDFIIASLHWGFEFEFFPREKQIKIAHDLVEWGADAIIAHHPHVLQPVEHYSTYRDPHRIAVIAYSLGSLNLPFSAPHIALSGILNLTLSKGKVQGKSITYIEKSHITPVFSQSVELNGKRVMRLQKLMTNLSTDLKTEEKNYLKKIKQYADLVMRT